MSVAEEVPIILKSEHERLNRALRMAVAANNALMKSTGELQLFQTVCDIAVEIGGYKMAWIGYVDYDEKKSIRPVTYAGIEAGYLESLNLTWADNERGRGPSGTAVRTGQLQIMRSIATDPAFQVWREDALRRGFESSIALPLKIDGKVVSQLAIYSSAPDAFDVHEVEVLQELANALGIGISFVRAKQKREIAEGMASELGVALEKAIVQSINNEILFRSIFEQSPMGIVRFDSKWRFLSVNEAYAQMTGFSEVELMKMTIMDVTHPEDRKVTEDTRPNENVTIVRGFEKRYITKSGKLIWTRIFGRRIKIEGSDEPNWIAVVEDITERRELEAKLETEQRKTLQNAKLASLGEMSAGIAHEINNPITVILGSLSLLERDRLLPENFTKTLGQIRKAGQKIAHIVSGLTKFSRRSEYSSKTSVVFADIIEDVVNIIRPTAKRYVTNIEMDMKSRAKINCNEIEIAQVVQNLLANGIDAARNSSENWVQVRLFEADGQVILRVIDSGHGIPHGLEEKIFEPFYTSKPAGSGTGLGLSIVRGIVTDHEGALELLKVDGHTCFELRFSTVI